MNHFMYFTFITGTCRLLLEHIGETTLDANFWVFIGGYWNLQYTLSYLSSKGRKCVRKSATWVASTYVLDSFSYEYVKDWNYDYWVYNTFNGLSGSLQGSQCGDNCLTMCLMPCIMCQMHSELKLMGVMKERGIAGELFQCPGDPVCRCWALCLSGSIALSRPEATADIRISRS